MEAAVVGSNAFTIKVAVCAVLLPVLVIAFPVGSSDLYSSSLESTLPTSTGSGIIPEDEAETKIVLENTTLNASVYISNSSEMVAMDLILLANENVPDEIQHELFEGDIMMPSPNSSSESTHPHHTIYKRNALDESSTRWPEGIVPYIIDDSYDDSSRRHIISAFTIIHISTCIRFVPRIDQRDYIHILPKNGCWSYIGRQGGRQELSVVKSCLSRRWEGSVVHELIHALGFVHEQSRPDRDEFVEIIWENIQADKRNNFRKYSMSDLEDLNTAYDFHSVMHYGNKAFSVNDQPTIVPKNNAQMGMVIGNRRGLSRIDAIELKRSYNCTCRDMDSQCSRWANEGRCVTEADYMLEYCKKSCKVCGPGSKNACIDKHPRCNHNDWKAKCHTRKVRRLCKRTCRVCSPKDSKE
ncbi:zinc metalloproteinase nas-4-like [Acanthaster planci]|uniref:Metalloendopeptidase n=1 Tax=Acanthaster planci TaxID=133434 RepID=A0A8B7XSN8_ACAPL|nr:zinc metalloproteinase nas-4-like [Acanthaster planci]